MDVREGLQKLKENIEANLKKSKELEEREKEKGRYAAIYAKGYSDALRHVLDYIKIIEAMYGEKNHRPGGESR